VPADAHFTSDLPAKRVAADCLFTDQAGCLLVLDPPYKLTWDIPGGVVEGDESPRHAAQREVYEEVGLQIEPGELLAVDWKSRDGGSTEVLALLFDGGTLSAADIDRIVTEPSEVRGYRFVVVEEAARLLDAELFARVVAGLAARTSTQIAYLENGVPPGRTSGLTS
jgi:ADP-ribose pyrophosphatase YjhB (NUDIX family)